MKTATQFEYFHLIECNIFSIPCLNLILYAQLDPSRTGSIV
jgi:hypothetical protein